MALDTSGLRVPDDGFPPIKDRIVTLIRITANDVTQASTVTDKRAMLSSTKDDDTLIAVWTGQWSSDAFEVPIELRSRWKQQLLK